MRKTSRSNLPVDIEAESACAPPSLAAAPPLPLTEDVAGNFSSIGMPVNPGDLTDLLICQSADTAKALHKAADLPVICASSPANLLPTAVAVRKQYPSVRLVICGDDDWQTAEPDENPGRTAATAAAAAAGGILALPSFGDRPRAATDTDFAAMAARLGDVAVWALIHGALEDATPPAATNESQGDEFDCSVAGYTSRNGKITLGSDEPVVLANFTARIVGEIVVDDGVERSKRLEIAWRARNRRGTFQLPAAEFQGLQWPMQEIGAGAIIAPGATRRDHLRAAIQYLSGDIPLRYLYAQTGWREHNGHWAYLHNSGAIGATGVATELRNGLQHYDLPPPPTGVDLRAAVEASIRLLDVAPPRVACPLFAAIYRAPLQRADFSLLLIGQSGSGKSSVAALAQAHYGKAMADRTSLPADWSSTANALEFMAFQAADALLVIDEGEAAQGSPAARAELENKIGRILRAIGNQSTRSRMGPNGRMLPDKPPRALVVATKEEGIAGFSLVARTLTLNLNPGEAAGGRGVSGLGPWQEDAHSGRYAQALAGYVAWLGQNFLAKKALFRERFEIARAKLVSRVAHPRTADTLAQLTGAAWLFLRFAIEANAITEKAATMLHSRIISGLIDAANDQILAQCASDPVDTFFELLHAVLASGRAHLKNQAGGPPPNPLAHGWIKTDYGFEPKGDLAGWVAADGTLYLQMEAAFAACQRLARETGQSIEVGPNALRKRIDAKRLIISKEGGQKKRLTNRVLIDGVKVTVLHCASPWATVDEDADHGLNEDRPLRTSAA